MSADFTLDVFMWWEKYFDPSLVDKPLTIKCIKKLNDSWHINKLANILNEIRCFNTI